MCNPMTHMKHLRANTLPLVGAQTKYRFHGTQALGNRDQVRQLHPIERTAYAINLDG